MIPEISLLEKNELVIHSTRFGVNFDKSPLISRNFTTKQIQKLSVPRRQGLICCIIMEYSLTIHRNRIVDTNTSNHCLGKRRRRIFIWWVSVIIEAYQGKQLRKSPNLGVAT